MSDNSSIPHSIQAKLLIGASTTTRRIDYMMRHMMSGGSRKTRNETTSSLLGPLLRHGGIVFPYTPEMVQFGHTANYESFVPTHSNFQYNRYRNSTVNDIVLTASFTATTQEEFAYMLASFHFLKTVMKMNSGGNIIGKQNWTEDPNRGAPPPILQFSYGGPAWAQDVPVVLTTFDYQLTNNEQLVSVMGLSDEDMLTEILRNTIVKDSMAPIRQIFTISLRPHYRPETTRTKFSVKEFGSGDLLRRGFM